MFEWRTIERISAILRNITEHNTYQGWILWYLNHLCRRQQFVLGQFLSLVLEGRSVSAIIHLKL